MQTLNCSKKDRKASQTRLRPLRSQRSTVIGETPPKNAPQISLSAYPASPSPTPFSFWQSFSLSLCTLSPPHRSPVVKVSTDKYVKTQEISRMIAASPTVRTTRIRAQEKKVTCRQHSEGRAQVPALQESSPSLSASKADDFAKELCVRS